MRREAEEEAENLVNTSHRRMERVPKAKENSGMTAVEDPAAEIEVLT